MAETIELKLKNVSNPLELLSTLKAISKDLACSCEITDKLKNFYESLTGSLYVKAFTDLDKCSLLCGSSNLSEGYLYC